MRVGYSRRQIPLRLTVIALLAMWIPWPASSTWSIVAVDPRTGEVGSAGASCTDFVASIVGLAPGYGVIVAQARSNKDARSHGMQMLRAGASPQAVIAAVANETFDPHYQRQQYGVAALGFEDAPAAFTGADTRPWQGHATGKGVAVQGNILTGPGVVQAALSVFEKNQSRPLAEQLLAALEAGSKAGGDRRCGKQSALSAYLMVAKSGDAGEKPYLKLIVPGQKPGGPNPVRMLRKQFERQQAAAESGACGGAEAEQEGGGMP